jgi:hypothetical protein
MIIFHGKEVARFYREKIADKLETLGEKWMGGIDW